VPSERPCPRRSNAYTAKPASPSCRANGSYRELWSLSPCIRINTARGGSDGSHDCSKSCRPPRPWNALSEWLTGTKGRPPGFPELLLANELSESLRGGSAWPAMAIGIREKTKLTEGSWVEFMRVAILGVGGLGRPLAAELRTD